MLTPRFLPDRLQPRPAAQPAVLRSVRLTPSPDDHHLYVVKGIGTLRVTGWTWREATAEAGGRSWQMTRHGIWPPVLQAADVAGDIVGEFSGRWLHHGAALRSSNHELGLRIDRLRQDRYVLVDDDRRLATIDGVGSDKRPLNITINDAGIDAGPCCSRSTSCEHSRTITGPRPEISRVMNDLLAISIDDPRLPRHEWIANSRAARP